MVGGTLEEWLIEKIAVESGGNPLFAEETVKMLIQSGELVKSNSKWIVKDKRTLVILSVAREVMVQSWSPHRQAI